jgi:CDGSH-type Zn-finger protein
MSKRARTISGASAASQRAKGSEFRPVMWHAEEAATKWFCACKQTNGEPFCDGSHKALSAI